MTYRRPGTRILGAPSRTFLSNSHLPRAHFSEAHRTYSKEPVFYNRHVPDPLQVVCRRSSSRHYEAISVT
jgi:hypothetical protein